MYSEQYNLINKELSDLIQPNEFLFMLIEYRVAKHDYELKDSLAGFGIALGAAFISSSAIEKEIELKTIEILNIENIKITRTLSVLINPSCYKSRAFEFFYNELLILKNNLNVKKK